MTRNISVLAVLLFSLLSCNGQPDTCTVTIHNRSAFPIDSVAIPDVAFVTTEKINAHETKTITIKTPELTDGREGSFDIALYTRGFKRMGSWGFYWYGKVSIKHGEFYNFDNWLFLGDTMLPKPTTFNLSISDETMDHIIDSITIAKKAIKSVYKGVHGYHYELDYSLFEKDPTITIYQKGVATKATVKNDWNYWNTTSTFMYIYDNGEILYNLEYRVPKGKTGTK